MRLATVALAALSLTAVHLAARAGQGTPAPESPRAEVTVTVDDSDAPQAKDEQAKALAAQAEALKEQSKAMKDKARAMKEEANTLRIMGSSRPRIGVILETDADPDTDAIGARIQAVTPGGPADQAGIKSDDIIMKFNGVVLTGKNPEADEDESGPAVKLLALARQLKDGEKVPVEYRRGRETNTTTIIPRVLKEKDIRVMVNIPDLPELKDIEIPDLPEGFVFNFSNEMSDMELVALNPDLGEYFGTAEGILVVRAPANSPLKLKSGDVILKIGDRKPSTPSQALRILRSYEPKDTITMDVMRKRQKMQLTGTVPESKEFDWTPKPSAPHPPKAPKAAIRPTPAPAPPAAPAAPAPTGNA